MDYKLALITGIDIPISSLQVNIHQPTIKEISYIGEEEFFTAIQYITINKNSYFDSSLELQSTSNFKIFITVMLDQRAKEQKEYVTSLLTLLFPDYTTFFTPQSIILKNKSDGTLIIDENNFEIVQEVIKDIFCLNNHLNGQNMNYNPKGKKAKEIADKIMKGRKKISEEKGGRKQSILTRYLSILSVGQQQNINDLVNLTIYQIYDLIERYTLFVNWDINIRCSLAGAKNQNKPEDWMKDIH